MSKISFKIGDKTIGKKKVLIQSMSPYKTEDVEKNIQLTNELEAVGLDMMRFSVLDENDAKALKDIRQHVNVPVIADIHLSYDFAFLALKSNVEKIRINPGNMKDKKQLADLINECKKTNTAIRLGFNFGSCNHETTYEKFFSYVDGFVKVFEDCQYDHLVLSIKSSKVGETKDLNSFASLRYPYPFHVGLTESGLPVAGSINSALALIPLLTKGVGDTIRVSLNGDKKEEIRVCKQILALSDRRDNVPELIVCPTCGRTKADIHFAATVIQDKLDTINKKVKVAVMGCPINGIGEAKDADIGICAQDEDRFVVFEKSKLIGHYSLRGAIAIVFDFLNYLDENNTY